MGGENMWEHSQYDPHAPNKLPGEKYNYMKLVHFSESSGFLLGNRESHRPSSVVLWDDGWIE